jgi:hypothetical protein
VVAQGTSALGSAAQGPTSGELVKVLLAPEELRMPRGKSQVGTGAIHGLVREQGICGKVSQGSPSPLDALRLKGRALNRIYDLCYTIWLSLGKA